MTSAAHEKGMTDHDMTALLVDWEGPGRKQSFQTIRLCAPFGRDLLRVSSSRHAFVRWGGEDTGVAEQRPASPNSLRPPDLDHGPLR
jgi:hypothetical protein